jgi:hypothetical protein
MAQPMENERASACQNTLPAWLAEPISPPSVSGPAADSLPPKLTAGHSPEWCTATARLLADEPLSADDVAVLRRENPSPLFIAEPEPEEKLVEIDCCSKCGSLDMWQSIIGEWRCRKCRPPYPGSARFIRAALRCKAKYARQAALATPDSSALAVCRCGSTTWRDVPIHGGQSTRQDCGDCGRFIGFSVWHERATV